MHVLQCMQYAALSSCPGTCAGYYCHVLPHPPGCNKGLPSCCDICYMPHCITSKVAKGSSPQGGPHERDDGQCDTGLHDGGHQVLVAHHAGVKEGKAYSRGKGHIMLSMGHWSKCPVIDSIGSYPTNVALAVAKRGAVAATVEQRPTLHPRPLITGCIIS
jgi:hypothetical protein